MFFPELATLTQDIAVGWVLRLLETYPTAERIAKAHLTSLKKIPFSPPEKVEALHQAAGQSVATLRGQVAEALVRSLVAQVRHCQRAEKDLRRLLTAAFADLPSCPHGEATAAILVAKIVDIERFDTPNKLVNYFGIFPEENTSGVDNNGHPRPSGTLHMSRKGIDLVRSYLWNVSRPAIRHNPAIHALYRRNKAKGKRGDVVIGHCMRKLLRLVLVVGRLHPEPAAHPAVGADRLALGRRRDDRLGEHHLLPGRIAGGSRRSTVRRAMRLATRCVQSVVGTSPGRDPAFEEATTIPSDRARSDSGEAFTGHP